MGERHQRGWLKKEKRAQAETWGVVLPHYSTI